MEISIVKIWYQIGVALIAVFSWNARNVNWRQLCNCSGLKTAFVGTNFLGGRQISQSKILEEKRFEHALPFIWGPPQMCYVGDANGSCPQCPECYGRRETILVLGNTFVREDKKQGVQDKFWSETVATSICGLADHGKNAPHTMSCGDGSCPQSPHLQLGM